MQQINCKLKIKIGAHTTCDTLDIVDKYLIFH